MPFLIFSYDYLHVTNSTTHINLFDYTIEKYISIYLAVKKCYILVFYKFRLIVEHCLELQSPTWL